MRKYIVSFILTIVILLSSSTPVSPGTSVSKTIAPIPINQTLSQEIFDQEQPADPTFTFAAP